MMREILIAMMLGIYTIMILMMITSLVYRLVVI